MKTKQIPLAEYHNLIRKNDWDVVERQIKSELTGLPYTQVIEGELMICLRPCSSPELTKYEMAEAIEHILKNTERIHGKSEVLDWIKIGAHKAATYILASALQAKDSPEPMSDDKIEDEKRTLVNNAIESWLAKQRFNSSKSLSLKNKIWRIFYAKDFYTKAMRDGKIQPQE